ncbi:hypothetical protein F9U64_21580 [Gracilibacillus oryzae]|uniref:Uncharacterized protein n=1 Tax=Gracilibacillus oryzae TaxID=1672701 RepID=A0A7C8KRW1_9BACI|nr:DUF5696 domain-containing protein [Gracilibacillus oryzae]KAB8125809.1 hypothetical protein F9U64_21580 [Gracilibacillus oryzae]
MSKRTTRTAVPWVIMALLSVMIFAPLPLLADEEEEQTEENPEEIGQEMAEEESAQGISQAELEGFREDISETVIEEQLQSMELIAENKTLALYIDSQTLEIAVKVKQSDRVWFSNPADRESDSIANGENKALLDSQFSITYYNRYGQSSVMHSSVSADNGQFEMVPSENGVTVIYTLGDMSKGIDAIPKRISTERLESAILNKIEDEKLREDLQKRFMYIEEEDVYERRDESFPKVVLERTLTLFEEIGYNEEELAIDNAEAGGNEETGDGKPVFTIPIEYKLAEEQLLVSIDSANIEQNEHFPIGEIDLLPFFGAANEHRSGYMFIPDGSGALIYLNNGKTNYQPIDIPVYGEDLAEFTRRKMEVVQPARLPVFGMQQEEKGFLTVVEEGSGIASIKADVAGRLNLYNSVYSSFELKKKGEVSLSGGDRESTVSLFQEESYQGNMVLRYQFLQDQDTSYSHMATTYRDYLIEKEGLSAISEAEDIPFYLELMGSIWKRKTILGIPYKSLEPLTTFEQAEHILNELLAADVSTVKLRYNGWFNNGIHHSIPTKINIDKEIGGKNGLEAFQAYLKENDIPLFPDAAFMNVHRNSFAFQPSRDAARYLTKKIAERYPYNPASFLVDRTKSSFYLLSPDKLETTIQKFTDSFTELGIGQLALRDLGDRLHADYRTDNVIDREEARKIVETQLDYLTDNVSELMVNGGNAYVLPHSDHVLEIPATSSGYNMTDESIPFYQMVIHGSIDYAAQPMNLAADQNGNRQLLKALETGSNPYFQWFYEDPTVVKDTEFNHLYSSHYQIWLEDAISIYQESNQVLSKVRHLPITSHKKIQQGVYETQYGEEYIVTVNYNSHSIQANGETIEAEGYTFRKER